MKRSKFSEEQVAYALRQAEAGTAVGDVCRQLGISEATFYVWKKRYGHLAPPLRTPRKELEEENTKLKRLYAELALENAAIKDVLFWKCFDRLRLDGHRWNHKRVHRVYCALRLNLPRRMKRRAPTRLRQPLVAPTTLNGIWALDFMQDALYGGRRFRTLNILDEVNREALAIEIGTSIPAARVVRVLEQLLLLHGRPAALRLDNGPELTAECFASWCEAHGIELRYIQPGKPDQNALIERFNRTNREEVLDAYVFESLAEVQRLTDEWLTDYNEQRPHDGLGRVPPTCFYPRPLPTPEDSNNAVCP